MKTTTSRQTTRRRFLTITAAAVSLAPLTSYSGRAKAGPTSTLHQWHGQALGAEAHLTMHLSDPEKAEKLIRQCRDEIARLEYIFSLNRRGTVLSALNDQGFYTQPPRELVRLLEQSQSISEATGGAFDVTVQPLWKLYAAHFVQPRNTGDTPPPKAVEMAQAAVGYRHVDIGRRKVSFGRPGMGVTLNGIAQGYITDRITELLRDAGLDHVLVEMGEARTLGTHPSGRDWQLGILDPLDRTRLAQTITLDDAALATSGGYGTPFDATGNHHHLFDPKTGRSAKFHASVSVIAPTATQADALSTALSALPLGDARDLIASTPGTRALLIDADGKPLWLG